MGVYVHKERPHKVFTLIYEIGGSLRLLTGIRADDAQHARELGLAKIKRGFRAMPVQPYVKTHLVLRGTATVAA